MFDGCKFDYEITRQQIGKNIKIKRHLFDVFFIFSLYFS